MQSCLLSHWFCLLSTNIKITLQSKRWLVQEQETGLDGSFTTPCVTWHQDNQPQLGLDLRVQHLHGGTTCQPAQRQAVQQCGPRPRGPEPLHWGPPVLPQGCQVKHLSTVSSSQTISRKPECSGYILINEFLTPFIMGCQRPCTLCEVT